MLTIKKSNFLLLLLAVIGITSFFAISCNHKLTGVAGRAPVLIELPEDKSGLDKINHFISEDSIKIYRALFERTAGRFTQVGVHVPASEAFNKRAILSLLKASDCVGIRIYHGAKTARDRSELRLVLVGVDSNGKDILIDRSSALTLKVTSDMGGEENGQCPDCITNF